VGRRRRVFKKSNAKNALEKRTNNNKKKGDWTNKKWKKIFLFENKIQGKKNKIKNIFDDR